MRVAVTGATGMIGRALVTALRTRGDEVTALSRSAERAQRELAEEAAGAGAVGVARQDGELVATRAQLRDERASDQACGSGDCDSQATGATSGAWVAPVRSASSATALATARLTSRLKTLGTM